MDDDKNDNEFPHMPPHLPLPPLPNIPPPTLPNIPKIELPWADADKAVASEMAPAPVPVREVKFAIVSTLPYVCMAHRVPGGGEVTNCACRPPRAEQPVTRISVSTMTPVGNFPAPIMTPEEPDNDTIIHLVDIVEIARRLHLARIQTVHNWIRRYENFPPAVRTFNPDSKKPFRIYWWPDIEEWFRQHRLKHCRRPRSAR